LRVLALVLVAIAFAGGRGFCETIRVNWAGGSDYLTIQEGVTAAEEGDTVLVAPGVYSGSGNSGINFEGTNIVLMSEAGAGNTTIDCLGLGAAIGLYNGEDSTSVVRGFTITNGGGGNGGGMQINHAAAIVEDCVFSGNTAAMNGGGLYYGYPTSPGAVRNCIFVNNSAPYRGGGLECYGGDPATEPRITNCVFYDNYASSGGDYGGGGIYCNYGRVTITGCTLVGNGGGPGAGGIHGNASTVTISNTVVAYSTEGEGMYGVNADHCVIYGNAGGDTLIGQTGNLYQEPLFCNMDNDDFTLCANSPCLPAYNPWTELIGAYDAGCGECETKVEPAAWGYLKILFR
jgi:hypothetical protein